ncbi:MAG: hypothetical protein H7177_08290 [Rhizobacter sp.]|nr:hypothetical protein [Bacteriovorax sp.]
MKRMFLFRSFIFACFLVLASCGGDNTTGAKAASSNTSSLTGGECACAATYAPVCGKNSSGNNISYDNQCIANCYKATNVVQGNCECSEALRVCGTDGGDYTECEARIYHITIKKYGTCASGSY